MGFELCVVFACTYPPDPLCPPRAPLRVGPLRPLTVKALSNSGTVRTLAIYSAAITVLLPIEYKGRVRFVEQV